MVIYSSCLICVFYHL